MHASCEEVTRVCVSKCKGKYKVKFIFYHKLAKYIDYVTLFFLFLIVIAGCVWGMDKK